jgi:RNA polymerase sigma-70 factor (ECF subfamily)
MLKGTRARSARFTGRSHSSRRRRERREALARPLPSLDRSGEPIGRSQRRKAENRFGGCGRVEDVPTAEAQLTDADALAASIDRPAAFAHVFERHHAEIHRYLSRRLGTHLADELAAETFATAFAKRARYDAAFADARPWLFGIATRLAQRHWRREERELRAYARTGADPAVPSHDDRAASDADAAAAGPALAAALARLTRNERDVLLLYAWEDLGYGEIAAALSISPGTVKSRLHRARGRVRQSLAAAGELDHLEESR